MSKKASLTSGLRILYSSGDSARRIPQNSNRGINYRHPYNRDVSRLIHSPSFRRLQGKTQLFPFNESDFFRNRLTHSIEVSDIGKAIALKLNNDPFITDCNEPINVNIVEFAGLAHDIGLPPFGHTGEQMLDEIMKDFGGFEGNAQTLRILSRLEKKQFEGDCSDLRNSQELISQITNYDRRAGLNCTYRTLASILKYDVCIPYQSDQNQNRPIKGYYYFDKSLVDAIKNHVCGNSNIEEFKTIECSIMDIADDIAYSCYDLEDCLKAGFLSMQDFFSVNDEIAEKIRGRLKIPVCNTIEEVKDTLKQVFSKHIFKPSVSLMKDIIDAVTSSDNEERATILSLSASTKYIDNISKLFKMMSCQGYERTEFTASLVDDFISNIELIPNEQYPALSKVRLKDETAKKVEVLKQFNYVKIITSPMLKIVEHRGKDIINKLFISLKENPCLLPNDFKILFDSFKNEAEKNRVVCDFIAGMTDRFAVEYYSRLFSESAESIFKPV